MNIQDYIESGNLELYAAGALTPAEMEEVEVLCAHHPELAKELQEIQDAMNRYAETHAIKPAKSMKLRIMNAIDTQETKQNSGLIIKLNPRTSSYAIAASIALLIASNIGLVATWMNLQDTKEALAQLSEKNISYASEMIRIKKATQYFDELRDPAMINIALKGSAMSPNSGAVVHWNAATQQVLIDLVNLPLNDQEHQYQLWALIDGKPVDVGMFEGGDASTIIAMKGIDRADAFAVTLEPRGGSKQPTMEQMYLYAPIRKA